MDTYTEIVDTQTNGGYNTLIVDTHIKIVDTHAQIVDTYT